MRKSSRLALRCRLFVMIVACLGATAAVLPAQESTDAHGHSHAADESRLTAFVRTEQLTVGMLAFALATAGFLGAAHALSPGHGKAMVAAYLIGSRGRVRDAIGLGLVVTLTHVASVVLLGLGALCLSAYLVPEHLTPWLGAFSGGLVFCLGYWMVARRALAAGRLCASVSSQGHGHAHEAPHGHAHGHSHAPDGPITFSSLLSLGVAGGMVPCPAALVVLLVAASTGRILLGLSLVAAFSAGLAVVLMLIGILTVTASRLADRFVASRGWIQSLPVFSAGAVMLIGLGIAFRSLMAGGVISVHW